MSSTDPVLVTPRTLREWPLPAPGEGKEERGSVLVVGGTAETPGSLRLAGEAALRAGAGKLRVATVRDVAAALAVALPEAAVTGYPPDSRGGIDPAVSGDLREQARHVDVLVLGPGLRDPEQAADLAAGLLADAPEAVVLDGLASAYLGRHPDGPGGDRRAVLSVNPGELARTAGVGEEEVGDDIAGHARAVAERSGLVITCGGSQKYVADPGGDTWIVAGGGPGLGVSGSGDVEAGIVAGLLARGAAPAQAAVWAAYLHARLGERLSAQVGSVGYLAREMPAEVPRVLAELG
jgi:ADP-dependent NAD(P)H-hydrate dehydratase